MYKCAEILLARENLVTINTNTYPHATKRYQEKLHKDFYKAAFPVTDSGKTVTGMTTEEVFKALAGG